MILSFHFSIFLPNIVAIDVLNPLTYWIMWLKDFCELLKTATIRIYAILRAH